MLRNVVSCYLSFTVHVRVIHSRARTVEDCFNTDGNIKTDISSRYLKLVSHETHTDLSLELDLNFLLVTVLICVSLYHAICASIISI